jgi:hypothetical protein
VQMRGVGVAAAAYPAPHSFPHHPWDIIRLCAQGMRTTGWGYVHSSPINIEIPSTPSPTALTSSRLQILLCCHNSIHSKVALWPTMSTHTLAGQSLLQNGTALDTIIGQLLGQGLGYDDWKMELGNLGGFAWTESLKNSIIKREFNFFREEILRLQSEPNTARGLKSKTNSLESILKRLQGLEWLKGVPNEMEQRRRDGRLLGKDAK